MNVENEAKYDLPRANFPFTICLRGVDISTGQALKLNVGRVMRRRASESLNSWKNEEKNALSMLEDREEQES